MPRPLDIESGVPQTPVLPLSLNERRLAIHALAVPKALFESSGPTEYHPSCGTLIRIFEMATEWIFELTGLTSPGGSTLKSLTLKALERRADGVVIPEATDGPLMVVAFQFQKEPTIYPRIVVEMALLQQSHQMRPIQGLIFFGYNDLDPKEFVAVPTLGWLR